MALIPILISGCGRSGTTMLMELLATDARVVFDRRYPNENRYLTYLAKLALLTGRPGDGPHLNSVQLCDFEDGRFGSFPWPTNPVAGLEPPLAPPPAAWLATLWGAFSEEARRRRPTATYYAEKTPSWLAGTVRDTLPSRTLHLARDPRDVFLSAKAFNRARNVVGTGAGSDPDLDDARDLAYAQTLYYENDCADRGRSDITRVRYEDMVADWAGEAVRLGQFLNLDLRPTAPGGAAAVAGHRTITDAAASVGRWRREPLPTGVRERLESLLADFLADYSYGGVDSEPAASFQLAELHARGSLVQSADGELQPGSKGVADVRIRGEDFWINLPPQALAAATVHEVWVSVQGGIGDHCSLYWRGPGEGFAQERSIHVPYQAGGHWHVLRFRVAGHPFWRGTVEQLRLDLFNGFVTTEATGAVHWLRLVS